ncbi:MAG: hypothetical protein JNM63_02275 [Spirochaetia bacterium]|nr:hypothetical protein [Spirochaetia bacterium]
MRYLIFALVFAIVGLAVGYLIFARVHGAYVPVKNIFFPAGDFMGKVGQLFSTPLFADVETIRKNILILGAAGGAVGLVVAGISGRRRRR